MSRLSAGTIRTVLHRLALIDKNTDFVKRMSPAMMAVCDGNQDLVSEIRDILLRASIADIEVEPAREKETV